MTGRTLTKRYPCSICLNTYILRRDGTLPWHGLRDGHHYPGSGLPPKVPITAPQRGGIDTVYLPGDAL